jgi:hypothetical protein
MKPQAENETEWKDNDPKQIRRYLMKQYLVEITMGVFFLSVAIIWALTSGKILIILVGLIILSLFLLVVAIIYLVNKNFNPIKVGIDSKGIHLVCNKEKNNRFRAWNEIAKVSHSKFHHLHYIRYKPANRRQRADFVSEEIGQAILNRITTKQQKT